MNRLFVHCSHALGALGLAACTTPGVPAPVNTTSAPSPSAWQWQSQEPMNGASGSSGADGHTGTPSSPPNTAVPTDSQATRRLAYQPGVAGQPMAAVGECVDFQRAQDSHTTFVARPCDQPHHGQVVGYVDLHVGPQAPAPSLAVLQGVAAQHCPILGGEFIGSSLATRRDLTVNWTGPAKREWVGGARTVVCLLSGVPSSDGQGTQPLVGDLRAQGSVSSQPTANAGSTENPTAPLPQPNAPSVAPAPPVAS